MKTTGCELFMSLKLRFFQYDLLTAFMTKNNFSAKIIFISQLSVILLYEANKVA